MKYLVTGGAGFIGSRVVKRLLSLNHSIIIIDDFSTGSMRNIEEIKDDVEIINGSINDSSKLKTALNGVDGIFHFASKIFASESFEEPQAYFHVGIEGTLNLIQEAIHSNIPKIIFSSSSAVYGNTTSLPVLETHVPIPLSPYGLAKLTAEECGRLYAEKYGLSFISLRYFNVYGKGQSSNSPYSGVIARFIDNLKAGRPLTIYGDGTQLRDFVHVEDIVNANIQSMFDADISCGVFNCATNRSTSILELANLLSSIFKKTPEIQKSAPRMGDILESKGSYDAINSALDWSPKYDLESGLIEMLSADIHEL